MAAHDDDDSLSGDGRVDLSAFRRVGGGGGGTGGLGLGFDLDEMIGSQSPGPAPSSTRTTATKKKTKGGFSCLGGGKDGGEAWADSDSEDSDDDKHSGAAAQFKKPASGGNAALFRSAYPMNLILHDLEARKFFKVYASKEYSLENLLAWETLCDYVAEPNPRKRVETFVTLSETFFSVDSPQHVNIPHPTPEELQQIRQGLDDPARSEDTLERCDQIAAYSKQTLELTNLNDIYLRFTRSSDFEDMLRATSLRPPA